MYIITFKKKNSYIILLNLYFLLIKNRNPADYKSFKAYVRMI